MAMPDDADGLIVVGGSDAGVMAGLWARRTDPSLRVTLVIRDNYANYSICGLPFFLSGETPEWSMLAHRRVEHLEAAGLRLMLNHEVVAIDARAHAVTVRGPDAQHLPLSYDSLVVGTGAVPVVPPLPGIARSGVHVLHTMDQARALDAELATGARRAVIVGAGYIGVELADALTTRGLDVAVVEMAPQALTTLDPDLGALVTTELRDNGVDLYTSAKVERIENSGEAGLRVLGSPGIDLKADLVVVAVGVRPESRLLAEAGAELTPRGAVVVDTDMRTGLDRVWAAGDCVHTHHVLLNDPTYLPLGTTAHKQGRVAGINAAGGTATFAGSCGTQAVKAFGLVAARTGLSTAAATAAGYAPSSVDLAVDDHKAYYPGATSIHARITGDGASRRLLGLQLVGAYGAEVSKRVDIAATIIHAGGSIQSLLDLDLSYTPPLSSPWDPVQAAADAWVTANPSPTGRLTQ